MDTEENQFRGIVRKSYPEEIVPVRTTAHVLPRGDEARTTHLREYLNVILARRASFITVVLAVLAIGTIQLYKEIPVYLATATVQIDPESDKVLSFQDVTPAATRGDDALQTQYKILESESLARSVVDDLHLNQQPAPAAAESPNPILVAWADARQAVGDILHTLLSPPAAQTPARKNPADADPLRPYVNAYLGGLIITPVLRTRLVTVGYESTDPELAAKIANAHAEHFIEQNLRFKWDATQVASDFLRKELATMRSDLEKSEDNLQAYSQEHQIFVVNEGDAKDGQTKNIEAERLIDLQSAYTKAQTERIEKESAARLARDGANPSSGPAAPGSLESQLIDLQRQDAALAARFRPDFGPRKEIQNQIQTVTKAIEAEKADRIKTAEDEYITARDRELAFAAELEQQGEKVNRMKQEDVQYGILKREADSNRQLYDSLLLRLKEAGVSSSLRASNIRIVDRAQVPDAPIRPNTRRSTINTLALAVILGIGFVFFQEYMDSSVKSPDDVTKYFRLPTLGLIPRFTGDLSDSGTSGYLRSYISKHAGNKAAEPLETATIEVVSYAAPGSIWAEAYRSLRASLILSSPNHPPRTILVTSALPSEGKTATTANIALSLTRTGATVLLVDADMRRPRMDSLFELRNKPGLSNFLTGTESLESVIHETFAPSLFVIPCGVIPPNPGELILSSRFGEMLDTLRNRFDYVVIDSPPVSNVSDARIIGTEVEGVVFVVRALSTSRHVVSRSLEQLDKVRARVLGVVLNDYDMQNKGSYYYPYYKHYKSYKSLYAASPASAKTDDQGEAGA